MGAGHFRPMGQDRINSQDAQRREQNREDDGTFGAWASEESAAVLPAAVPHDFDNDGERPDRMNPEQVAEWVGHGQRFDEVPREDGEENQSAARSVTARRVSGEITFESHAADQTAFSGYWVVMDEDGQCQALPDEHFQNRYEPAASDTEDGEVLDGMASPSENPFANPLIQAEGDEDTHPDEHDEQAKEILHDTGIDPNDPRFKMLDEAEGKTRDAHIRAVKQGRTRWFRRLQMLTALGTGRRHVIMQGWRDMRRDTRIRKNLISEEQYWDSVAQDMYRQAEMLHHDALDEPAPESSAAASEFLDASMGPEPQPDPGVGIDLSPPPPPRLDDHASPDTDPVIGTSDPPETDMGREAGPFDSVPSEVSTDDAAPDTKRR